MKAKAQTTEKLPTDHLSPESAVGQTKRLSARLLLALLVAAALTSSLPAQQNLEDGDDNGYDSGAPGDPPERGEFQMLGFLQAKPRANGFALPGLARRFCRKIGRKRRRHACRGYSSSPN